MLLANQLRRRASRIAFAVALLCFCAHTFSAESEELMITKERAAELLQQSGFYGFGNLVLDERKRWRTVNIQYGKKTEIAIDQNGRIHVSEK